MDRTVALSLPTNIRQPWGISAFTRAYTDEKTALRILRREAHDEFT
jgi:hypothetical protein